MREELRESVERAIKQLPEEMLPVEVAHVVVAFVSAYSEDIDDVNRFLVLASIIGQNFAHDIKEMERSTKH